MVYAGIDYSISCPAICVYDSDSGPYTHSNCVYYYCQKGVSDREKERRSLLNLSNIHHAFQYDWKDTYHQYFGTADFFMSILLQYSVEEVAMEDYALGAIGRVFDIAEATGILKNFMMLSGIKFTVFAPTTVKKVFSGKGNSNKEGMLTAYKLRYHIDISSLFKEYLAIHPLENYEKEWLLIFLFIPDIKFYNDDIKDLESLFNAISYLSVVEEFAIKLNKMTQNQENN